MIDPAFRKEDKIRDLEKDALLQFTALDLCILQEFRKIRYGLLYTESYSDISELPTDAYRIPSEDIAKLIDLDDPDVDDALENHSIFLALQKIWSYAVAYPQTIYDLRENYSLGLQQDLVTVYETTDRIDKEIVGANEQKRKVSILRRLDEANSDEPLPERIRDLSLNIALMVGNLAETGDVSETAVIDYLFRSGGPSVTTDIVEAAGLTNIFQTIKNYLHINSGAFDPVNLDHLVHTWGRIFPESESTIFDMLHGKVLNLENSFRNSKAAQTQVDYRQEALELILNQLRKWITEIRLQELWNLSRNTSATLTLSIFRSLKALSPDMIFQFLPHKVLNLTANAISNNQIDLYWDPNTEQDLDHYNIYRGDHPGFPIDVTKDDPIAQVNTSSYSDTGLSRYTTYYYRVAAVNKFHLVGDLSDEASSQTTGSSAGGVAAVRLLSTTTTPTSYWSVKEDETGRLGWLYTLYFALKPTAKLFELYEFAYENTPDEDEIKKKIKDATDAKKIIPSALFPEMVDTATLYAVDSISALDFDRITRIDRALEDKVRRRGGLKALLTERKVEGVL